MKITYDNQIFGWQRYGGISRIYFELIKNLETTEEVEINLLGKFYINEYLKSANLNANKNSIYLNQKFQIPGRALRLINNLLEKKYIDCDIFHETYFTNTKRSISKNSVRVLSVYDMIHEKFPQNFSKYDPTIQEKKSAVERADHIICISESTRKDLLEYHDIDDSKTSVVYLGSDIKLPTEKFEENFLYQDYILYVGSRDGHKNFNTFLEAFSVNQDLKKNFNILAFGGGPFNEAENTFIKNNKIKATQISGTDSFLSRLYQNATLFIYPSTYEGFGIPPLEAMRLACPVACSNISSIPEVVGDAAVFFNPYEIDSINSALLSIIDSDSYRDILINKGLLQSQKFSWNKSSMDTYDIYKELLK